MIGNTTYLLLMSPQTRHNRHAFLLGRKTGSPSLITQGTRSSPPNRRAAITAHLVVDMDDGGQHVGQSFAGSRLRDANHVLSREGDRPALRLDRSRVLEPVGPARKEAYVHHLLGRSTAI